IQFDTEELNRNINRVNLSLNRSVRSLIVGLLLIGMLIGSAIVSLAPLENLRFLDFLPYDVFIFIFIIAAVLALGYVIYSIWISWRKKDE
ncbi:MAG: hypothetical protein GWN00_32835, partial [Aliifodinibius sp.]|nr:hypothetical protein [Fodinibius sp.]NIY29404.1 hypothetical protein [Fodinibius sp.]